MGTVVNTNIAALVAQRNLANTGAAFGKSVERLSSGLRINRAGDDAAGLAISEKLRYQIKGYNMALRNIQDGISLVQTAEGGLNEVHSMLQRMRELNVQKATGTLAAEDTDAINAELDALGTEIDRVASTTKFNGKVLFGTGAASVNVQAGYAASDTITISLAAISDAAGLDNTASLADLNDAIDEVSALRGDLGASQNILEHAINSVSVAAENLTASESRIRDLDVAKEMVDFTKAQILQQAGTAVLAQANQAPSTVLQLLR
jgi:flagellin